MNYTNQEQRIFNINIICPIESEQRKAAPDGAAFHDTAKARVLDAGIGALLSADGQEYPGVGSRNPVDHHLTGVRVADSDHSVAGSVIAAAWRTGSRFAASLSGRTGNARAAAG